MVAIPRRKTVTKTKKAPQKGVVVKAAKKIEKKSKLIPTRRVVVKDASQKTSQKDKIVIHNKTLEKKPVVLEKVSETAQPASAVVEKVHKPSFTKAKHTFAVARSRIQVMNFSPRRLPLGDTVLLAQTARVAGIFFAISGAVLSFIHMPVLGAFEFSDQAAQTVSTTVTVTTSSSTSGTDSTLSSIDTTPDVRVSIADQDVYAGIVPVTVVVAQATEVKVLVQNKNTNAILQVGPAARIDDTTWRIPWDTRMNPDAEYRVRVYVRNIYGGYDFTDSVWRLVRNTTTESTTAPPPTGTIGDVATTTTSAETQSSTTPTDTSIPAPILDILEANPVHGEVAMRVMVSNASEVKLYAKNIDKGTLYYVGYAIQKDAAEWRIAWNSAYVPNGTYAVRARAFIGSMSYETPARTMTVENDVTFVPTATNTTSIVPTATTTFDKEVSTDLKATASIELSKANPVSGFVEVRLTTSPVQGAEIYLVPKNSLTPMFVGQSYKKTDTSWIYAWDTRHTPNGEYSLFARLKTQYGQVDSGKVGVRILNDVVSTFTKEQEATLDSLKNVSDSLIKVSDGIDESDASSTKPVNIDPKKEVYIEPVKTFMQTVVVDDSEKKEIEILLEEFRTTLHEKMNELARATRDQDTEKIERIKHDIEMLKNEVMNKLPAKTEKKELVDRINAYLSQIVFTLQDLTEKNEKILKDRVGEAITKDSDQDTISDYDEVNLYKTNPFSADTDGDSYIDSAEISGGYDPHDSSSEALVAYESPKEVGVVREDLLAVSDITTLTNSDETTQSEPLKAIISGKGLPNSFVTLFIYSTPVVVTVKTDDTGAWSYIFDKEIENGQHEVYVGITDNEGRVVAKSNPLPFVKTAEAYSVGDDLNAAVAAEQAEPSLVNNKAMLLVASIAVVALGLVLILLGLHVGGNRKLIQPQESVVTS